MNLSELLSIILSDLENIDIDLLREIYELLPDTQVSYLSDVFKYILEYYDTQHEKPSSSYVAQMFSTFYTPTVLKSAPELIKTLLFELRKDITINRTLLALQSRDLTKAEEIINGNRNTGEFTETKATDICSIYDRRDSLPSGIPTGVAQLDKAYKGLSYKTNNILAAPQKAGKTTAAISIAYDAIMKYNMNVLYLTLEVSPEDVYANFYARHAHELGSALNAQDIKKNLLDEKGRAMLELTQNDFVQRLEKQGNHLSVVANHDIPEFNFTYIKQLLDIKTKEWGHIDFIVIDHIGLTGYYKMKGVSDMKERINTWIKWWTDMCKGYNERGFILLTLMQINRQGTALLRKGKQIGFEVLSDANESEKSASTITVMYTDQAMRLARSARIYSLANRNGSDMVPEAEDGSVTTYLNHADFILGHRAYGDTFSLKNKSLLKPAPVNEPSSEEIMGGLL